jgi:hypothetical protein
VRRVAAALVPVGLLALVACPSVGERAGSLPSGVTVVDTDARTRMGQIEDFVVYYGTGEIDGLARYDLAIIDPATLPRDEIADLRARGTIVVGYLSVGEIAAGDPWLTDGTVPRSWVLGRNRNWGSLFVDASQPGWQELMRQQAGELLLEYGFDGVFLDTVDTAVDVAPETGPGMVDLIAGLRRAFPAAVLIQNRGFALLPGSMHDVDAVMFEDLSTTYDFDRTAYRRIRPDEGLVSDLISVHEQSGVPILALDYAEDGDRTTARRAVRIARSYGFVPAVSVIALDEIPDYGTP